jgi:phosphoserine phosphatase
VRSEPRYATVILDVDSTLCSIEGIDWLARRRGAETMTLVARATESAMNGAVNLESVYGIRLGLVHPSKADIEALAEAYVASVAPGAAAAIGEWHDAGVDVHLVSGGIRNALGRLADSLNIPQASVHAVDVTFDASGEFSAFDNSSPLTTDTGKYEIVRSLELARPLLAAGDGNTDLALHDVADAFVAYTGFVQRARVVENSDFVSRSFDELSSIVFGRDCE